MNQESQNCSEIPDLIKLIEAKSIGMLTCLDYGGALVSMPITPLEIDDKGSIWFYVDPHFSNVCHLCSANLSFAERDCKIFMSLSGSTEINKNQANIERLWTNAAKTWFPEGPASINIALLKFSPYAVECWDMSRCKMVSIYSMNTSAVPSPSIRVVTPTEINAELISNLDGGREFRELTCD